MRKAIAGLLSLALVPTFAAAASSTPSTPSAPAASVGAAAPPTDVATGPDGAQVDDLPNPLEAKRRDLRQKGLDSVLRGEATPQKRGSSTVVKVADGADKAGNQRGKRAGTQDQYVELSREATDKIFVVLVEFGDQRDPNYPDQDTAPDIPGPTTFEGPLHNAIPEPDRTVDNSTVWQEDYDQPYFQDLYFGEEGDSVKTYYETQSSGRYSVDGQVTDWVKVPYNEARYGRSDGYPCDDNVCDNTWDLVRDGVNAWVAQQQAAGRTPEQIKTDLAAFDVWDRYDFDGDGNFDEPDGYLDHFQVVHAGGDQADGDPIQGEDAIWSHRWYAYSSDVGLTGPAANPLGGTEVGDTGLWVGDYTVQPENGGLSVFVHEYGHDLGLPDDYDTSGGGDNSLEYWTLMAQSRLNAEGEALGTRAGDLGAWNKLALGWLDYEIVAAGEERTLDLGPSEYNTAKPQAAIVTLPDKEVTFDYGEPFAGERMFWSGKGDNLNNTLTADLDLRTVSTASVSMKARFDIEAEYDYLYLQSSTDGGATWTSLDGTVDGKPFSRDGSNSPAISGSSGGKWVDVVVPFDSEVGKLGKVRLLYRTDGGVAPDGFFADQLTITADGRSNVEGAEAPNPGLTLDGFTTTTGTETGAFPNYYLVAGRSYVSNDQYLKTGPYNFGFPDRPDFAEHYAYQQGLLITYLDGSQADNNTNEHPGEGRSLNIDSRPRPINNLCGTTWRTRIQVYDAPFTKRTADSMTLHCDGRASYVRGQAGQPVFDDSKQWWYASQPNHGVKVPVNGVRIAVTKETGTTTRVKFSSTK